MVDSGAIGLGIIVVHSRKEARLGHSLFWIQRYWLQAIGVAGQVDFRKKQVRRGVLHAVAAVCGLPDGYMSDAADDSNPSKTILLRTDLLIPWLCAKLRDFRDASAKEVVLRTLVGSLSSAMRGLRCPFESRPSFGGVLKLEVDDRGLVDINSLVDMMGSRLHIMWATCRAATRIPLEDISPGNVVPASSLFVFLDHKANEGTDVHSPMMQQLRNALLQILALGLEQDMVNSIAQTSAMQEPVTLLTKAGKRVRQNVVKKTKWLDAADRFMGLRRRCCVH